MFSLEERSRVVPDVLRKCGRPVVGRGFSRSTAWCHRAGTCPGSGAWTEYLTCWGPGLLRLGAIMSFGGYCVSRPGLLRLGAVVG